MLLEKILTIIMAGILIGSVAIGVIGTIHPEFPVKLPNYAKNYAIERLYGHAKEPSFKDIKLAQEKALEVVNPQIKTLEDLIKKIERGRQKVKESVGERKVSVKEWAEQFRKGAEKGSEVIQDIWRTGKHLVEEGWKKPRPHPPRKPRPIPPRLPRPRPPKVTPTILGVKSVIEGTYTYIYVKYKAPKGVVLNYYIDLGVCALKPVMEKVGYGVVRFVVSGRAIDYMIGFTMEMLSGMKVKLILWFEDRYGRPITEISKIEKLVEEKQLKLKDSILEKLRKIRHAVEFWSDPYDP